MGYVVIADGASVRDPEDGATRREEMHHLFLTRGQPLPDGLQDRALQSLKDQGAIAEEDSEEARLATSGLPRSSSLRRNPGTMLMSNEAEAIRAAQSAAQFPGGMAAVGAEQRESDLVRLPMESLLVFCKAFGIEVDEDADKAKLAKLIANGGNDPESAEDRETLRAERDQRQTESAETNPGTGVVPSKLGGGEKGSRGAKSGSEQTQTRSGQARQ